MAHFRVYLDEIDQIGDIIGASGGIGVGMTGASVGGTVSNSQYYIVQKGDTLSVIASRFGIPISDIAAANNISNPNLLYIGQQLIIPNGRSISNAGASISGNVGSASASIGGKLSGSSQNVNSNSQQLNNAPTEGFAESLIRGTGLSLSAIAIVVVAFLIIKDKR